MYTPERAWEKLKNGNARFISGNMHFPNISAKRRAETTEGQRPFAAILTCADSRTSPELIFDQGIGDLFVVRVAGNICDDLLSGSLEIGVEYCDTSLIVVMGHQNCGAISIAINEHASTPNLHKLMAKIQPAVDAARREHPDYEGSELINAAAKINARMAAEELVRSSESMREKIASGDLQVVAAYYNIDSGQVEWL